MKVLALILAALALADGKGSGPYLPSGWRPDGPAFFLPSEIVKPSPTPAVDINLQGSEASGSDFLQEYGPPKVQEISQNLLNQGLPDVTIEQTFGVSLQNSGLSQAVAEKVVEISEAKPEAISEEQPTTISQSSIDDNPPISAELPILDFEYKETATISNIEPATEIVSQTNQGNPQESKVQSDQLNSQESISVQSNQQNSQTSLQYVSDQTNQQSSESLTTEVSNVQSNQQNSDSTEVNNVQSNQQISQESTGQSNQQESTQSVEYNQESSTVSDSEKVTASGDSIGNTEVLLVNAVAPAQRVPELQNIPDVIASLEKEISTQQAEISQAVSELASVQSLGEVPEGFLEYGPPGFAEYGPPKEDQEKINETRRRRRFSPRIRFGKK